MVNGMEGYCTNGHMMEEMVFFFLLEFSLFTYNIN